MTRRTRSPGGPIAPSAGYRNDPEVRKAYQAAYRADPTRRAEIRARGQVYIRRLDVKERAIAREYGITVERLAAMRAEHNGVCAICERPETRPRALSVDHCHKTGKVRGLLCSRCNVFLGGAEDSTTLLRAALAYLEKHGA